MASSFAFYLDASSCSGCRTCQIACKDKHGLPVGVSWRRVYEITGGGWTRQGDGWVADVSAYNLSMACNHCARPICVEVCPTRAICCRPDGIVLIDEQKCIGCCYCRWACPYGAPQYDTGAGHMTKCTCCTDRLDRGMPPTCVAACPLRALDFGPRQELEQKYGQTAHVSPLPPNRLTDPSLVITAHRDSYRACQLGVGEMRVHKA